MKQFLALLFLLISTCNLHAQNKLPELKVKKGDRYISDQNGKPFFWLGDTAWELLHRLSFEEAKMYLKNRADKGFNVVLAVIGADFEGSNVPNKYGDIVFENNDPTKPVEKYFKHVDRVVEEANKLGIYMGLLPTWGDKFSKKWDYGPEILTPENAKVYGDFLAKRYKSKGVIWVLGGDRDPENEKHTAIINAMATSIRKVAGGSQLITYHPTGASYSSKHFHNSDWLDLNLVQSGHNFRNLKNYTMIRKDYAKTPPKPTIDAEPRYEDHAINWKPENGYFNDFDVRQAAWWSFLSGAAGHTYGCHPVWQMFNNALHKPMSFAKTNWQQAIDLPGAFDMGYVRKLADSHPWETLVPNQEIIKNENPENGGYQIGALSAAKDFAFIYSPLGLPLSINLTKFSAKTLLVYWFNPRDGSSLKIGEYGNNKTEEFKPYAAGPDTDWVLVIDDATKPWAGYNLKKQ
ncbi:glycoside hydrolase family 140 protein [Dyadobacter luticola]|uniref:DUF4038 domain-containing protein n=1 Tax=Dyadobacter luticola TaxID=1979387 RepID=A0A5R9KT74_9BACT|nr:glycoside hydrolase family 140 protein [Dyadobacter luticola]TLU99471.1 DUF4038 domain-containing protein [Dyadobacter luticola]